MGSTIQIYDIIIKNGTNWNIGVNFLRFCISFIYFNGKTFHMTCYWFTVIFANKWFEMVFFLVIGLFYEQI